MRMCVLRLPGSLFCKVPFPPHPPTQDADVRPCNSLLGCRAFPPHPPTQDADVRPCNSLLGCCQMFVSFLFCKVPSLLISNSRCGCAFPPHPPTQDADVRPCNSLLGCCQLSPQLYRDTRQGNEQIT
ncbi:hypothetical protein RRG08_037563 [Elysia crispata]|uniref:Uncharacterized protein n=1 Tax=Elysia crispata TaxID=231223 RepID=A0AAE0Y6E6_9GAST|nr:hypothetical protein RRG08_037563 [Elysia crispata]